MSGTRLPWRSSTPTSHRRDAVVAAVSLPSCPASSPCTWAPSACTHLSTTSMEAHRGEIARWLEVLTAKGASLWLDLRLPAALFGCSSLTRLHVGVWRLPDTRDILRGAAFPHLHEMVLSCIVMEYRDLAFLLDKSNALEALAIITCQTNMVELVCVCLASCILRIFQVCLTIVNYIDVVDAPRLERLMLWMTSKH
uniref:F-box/LRR-repeat protein 15/At3g58940/PEG3-like LRR domain-containing protein n=1 Tax=Oryza glumipatula TaxID=40148 RepID=A0A0E0B5C6_9ORYZ